MTRLEEVTIGYWRVSHALRSGDDLPKAKVTTEAAIKTCKAAEGLPPESWRLKELMHVLKFDIIEGDTKWRQQGKNGFALILPMKR